MSYADFQNELYLGGLTGGRPRYPATYDDLVEAAHAALEPGPFGYVAGGAGSEQTMAANREAFHRWQLVPRHLRDVSERDLTVQLFGSMLPTPVLLAPVGVQSIVHADAELAVARAAASVGVPMVLSTLSSHPLEQVAQALDTTPRWFQLYWPADRDLTQSFLRRAEDAGFSALMVTLDTRLLGWRPRDLDAAYLPFLHGEGIANYLSDPVFSASLDEAIEDELQRQVLRWLQVYADPAQTWDDLAWLCEQTELPVIAKGVLHPEDATLAIDAGCAGIGVSNHGGRQVDGSIAALDALPDVVETVSGRVPVIFDSGVRTGSDVLKALALGANAVLLGRPYVWGLALGGEDGVRHILRALLADLDLAMALCGVTSTSELGPEVLAPA